MKTDKISHPLPPGQCFKHWICKWERRSKSAHHLYNYKPRDYHLKSYAIIIIQIYMYTREVLSLFAMFSNPHSDSIVFKNKLLEELSGYGRLNYHEMLYLFIIGLSCFSFWLGHFLVPMPQSCQLTAVLGIDIYERVPVHAWKSTYIKWI